MSILIPRSRSKEDDRSEKAQPIQLEKVNSALLSKWKPFQNFEGSLSDLLTS